MVDTALALSKELREEQGVEVVIALTHCRVPNVSGPCPGVVGSVRGGLGIDMDRYWNVSGHEGIVAIQSLCVSDPQLSRRLTPRPDRSPRS
jgi:hypothetical protein